MRPHIILAALLAATPALAQSDGSCRGDARNVDRELALRADRLSPGERLQAQQRLSRAEGLCSQNSTQDSVRAGQDLEQLRRDMVQQATRPSGLPPGLPPPGPPRD